MWTKGALINHGFAAIGIGSRYDDLEPGEKDDALKALDAMVAGWESRGILIGYALDGSGVDADSGIDDVDAETVFTNLAVTLAPRFGKALMAETKSAARNGFARLLAQAAVPSAQPMRGGFPLGSGNKPRFLEPKFTADPSEADPLGYTP